MDRRKSCLRLAFGWVAAVWVLTACAGAAPPAQSDAAVGTPQIQRTLVLITRQEAPSVSGTSLVPGAFTTNSQRRPFNAWLTYADADDTPLPYLAEALPRLDTDSWRVFPDGRMETTYRLKPNLTWHDGAPLTAEDFVFAWRVYSNPDLAIASTRPHVAMEEVTAPDARTIVVAWKQPYYDAGMLTTNWTPLPRHLLEAALAQSSESFLNQPYWTSGFVGVGPYRLDRWERGAFIEGSAFEGHVWGKPRIDRIRISFIGDAEVVLANLLSGEGHVPVDNSIRVQQALVLNDRWAPTNGGTIIYQPTLWRWSTVQHRPEYANPPAIRDLRVRRALMHAMDEHELNETILDGKGIMSDSFIAPGVSYYADVDRVITKYPFDLRRSEQLMQEAGYQKGTDGSFSGPEGRPIFEYRVNTSAQNDAERSVLANGWRQAGFSFEEANLSPIETTQGELASTFRSLWSTSGQGGDTWINNILGTVVPGPENGWRGSNRGGWANPEYDRLVGAFNSSLVRSEREQTMVQVARIVTEELPVLPLFFNPAPWAWPSRVQGVRINAPNAEPTWNIHEWELK